MRLATVLPVTLAAARTSVTAAPNRCRATVADSARARRPNVRGRDGTLRPTKRERRAIVTAPGTYAASWWIGVLEGSISEAKPRSQLTKMCPRSSIWSTTPRSPAHRPESSVASCASSILAPIPTPARIRAARSLAPFASIAGISVSEPGSFTRPTLPRNASRAGYAAHLTKSRFAGGLLRTRRLRIGPSASPTTPRRPR